MFQVGLTVVRNLAMLNPNMSPDRADLEKFLFQSALLLVQEEQATGLNQ